jgi:hypothetical protein
LRKNNFTFSHLGFRPSLADASLTKSAKEFTIPVVLLPRIGQTSTQSKRQFCEVIFSQALSIKAAGYQSRYAYFESHCKEERPFMKVECESCAKSFDLPENRLPTGKKVSFPCPVCKSKITLDLERKPDSNKKKA